MENYLIGPWDHLTNTLPPGTVLEQYVPPELEKIAYQVMEQYEMLVFDMLLITSKPDKGVLSGELIQIMAHMTLKYCTEIPKEAYSVSAPSNIWLSKVPRYLPSFPIKKTRCMLKLVASYGS